MASKNGLCFWWVVFIIDNNGIGLKITNMITLTLSLMSGLCFDRVQRFLKIPVICLFLFLVNFSCDRNTSPVLPGKSNSVASWSESDFLFKRKFGGRIDDTLYYDNRKIKGFGEILIDDDGVESQLKVGIWQFFDLNGTLSAIGEFKVGSYVTCCTAGPCKDYYSYKIGLWKYFSDSIIIAKGSYDLEKYHIDTSCEGGDSLTVSLIGEDWMLFNENGMRITIDSINRTRYEYFDLEWADIRYYLDHSRRKVFVKKE